MLEILILLNCVVTIIQLIEERQLPFAVKPTDFIEKATRLVFSEQQYSLSPLKNKRVGPYEGNLTMICS